MNPCCAFVKQGNRDMLGTICNHDYWVINRFSKINKLGMAKGVMAAFKSMLLLMTLSCL